MVIHSIGENAVQICLDEKTLTFSFKKGDGKEWNWDKSYVPYMECESGKVLFGDAAKISHQPFHTGVGEGILSSVC